ncbi:MAG: ankyrin repeat domain-containing protein [Thermoanaerobaculia bacterium]
MTIREIVLIAWIFLTACVTLGDEKTDALFKAIRARDGATVNAMLGAGPSLLNAKDKQSGIVEVALFLNDGQGFVPMQSNATLQAVLAHQPPLDLFALAALGDATELRRRLTADASLVHARNHFGWTALHMAAFAGNVPNARLLLDHGADVNERAKTKFRNTPLLVAMLTGQYDVAKLLLDRGADVLDRQSKGFTAMHEAALLGRNDLIQLLLDRGAEINSRTDDGRSPLSEAIRGKHAEAVELLKSKGARAESGNGKLSESPD